MNARAPDALARDLAHLGYAVVPDVLDAPFLVRLRTDLERWIDRCDAIRRRNGLGASMRGVAHHLLGEDDAMADLVRALPLDAQIRHHFGGPYVLNSFGGLMHLDGPAADYTHAHRFHRDVRTYAGDFKLMVNLLLMLDDFSIDNGATRVLPGSHRIAERPPEDHFAAHAVHVTGRAGTALLFDSNLWHAASPNRNGEPRRALTLTFTRPLVKPQMDYPRLVGDGFSDDPRVREVLGFRSRIPDSHDAWYQPVEHHCYHADQG
jgi:ectoine hydroxylase-related dioxygenase (phytanoyl-CoA dioxygenase family)